jgi:Flp pilus assembly protein TadD
MTFLARLSREDLLNLKSGRGRLSLVVGAVGFLCVACASTEEPQVRFDEGRYQQILERQKAGLTVQDDLSDKLPKMTADDYERLGDTHFEQGNLTLALLQYNRALEGNSTRASALYKRGLVFLKERRWREAASQFQETLKSEPKSSLAHEGLGYANFQLGQDGSAEETLRQAITLDATRWQAHNFLGLVYDRQRRYRDAIAEYQAALALQPGEPSVSNNLGLAYHLDGQYDDAVDAFQQALRTRSNNPKIYNNLGLAYAKLERYPEALEAFKKGTEESQAYNNLGMVFLGTGNAPQAIACFEKAMELHPRYYAVAAENLARAQRLLGNHSSSEQKTGEQATTSCP